MIAAPAVLVGPSRLRNVLRCFAWMIGRGHRDCGGTLVDGANRMSPRSKVPQLWGAGRGFTGIPVSRLFLFTNFGGPISGFPEAQETILFSTTQNLC